MKILTPKSKGTEEVFVAEGLGQAALSFIDEKELIRRIGLCRKSVYNLRKRAQLPYCRLGKRIRYHWPSVEAKILSRQIGGFDQ